MLNIISLHNSLANRLHLRLVSHYSRVSGKPTPSGYDFDIYESITQLPQARWDNANFENNLFLSSAYLTALEKAPPSNMKFRYAIIRKRSTVVGIAYFQILELNHRIHKSPMSLYGNRKSLIRDIHDKIADTATFRLLVCGNALLSGEHGFSMKDLPDNLSLHVIAEIAYAIRKAATPRISVTLIKDFYNNHTSPGKVLSKFGFHSFDAGPNMVVKIRDGWTTFDNYLNEMKSKYRKRATSAIKKGSTIRRQNFSLEDIIKHRDTLFSLYAGVAGRAKFRIFVLPPDYFIELKRQLGEKFICEGYFSKTEMIGFTTRIINNDCMEGYTHGLDYEYNKEYELYQNFLLEDVKAAVSFKSSSINTGRTSTAMKSSIGAVPEEMTCYMRFSGKLSNQFIKPLFFFIKPKSEYCRNPFE